MRKQSPGLVSVSEAGYGLCRGCLQRSRSEARGRLPSSAATGRRVVLRLIVLLFLGVMQVANLPLSKAALAADDPGDVVASSVLQCVEAATTPLVQRAVQRHAQAANVQEFKSLTKTGQWSEIWPRKDAEPETRQVIAEIWNAAIQAALDKSGAVMIPAQEKPYYLDSPIILKSGQRLFADPEAEIRLKPGTSTCMLRNERVVGYQNGPVPESLQPDVDILIEGGIWTTLATMPSRSNGNARGRADLQDSVPGCHGVILLQNVRRVVVRNLIVRASRPFGVHLGTAREFLVENLTFEEHRRDGVHCDGPASFGIIRGIRGKTGDDPVSLLSWDWRQYSASFGPIHHILVADVSGAPAGQQSTDAIRLLPGVKQFPDGSALDCPITDCVLRDLTDIRDFKFFDQPNLEQGREQDFSARIGQLRNIRLERLVFTRPGVIQVHANTEGLVIRDVQLRFPVTSDYRLLWIGPQSATYKFDPADPARWTEILSPDLDCTVRGLTIQDVQVWREDRPEPLTDPYSLVRVIEQKVNPDYPKTTPRGGTGRGYLIR
ncbi:MAG: hypothetical protein KKI08_08225 [Armatimonadetes bacterium]|nr:hypothetical protein [Armatimonadota bacterium]